MAYVKISELPGINTATSPLTAGDVLPIVHGATTYKVQLSTLSDYFSTSFVSNSAISTTGTQTNAYVTVTIGTSALAIPLFRL